MPSSATRYVLIACAFLLAGCFGPPNRDLIFTPPIKAPASAIAATHEIFVATTRARSDRPAEVFSGARSPVTSFASVEVTVPAIHKTGVIERPKPGQRPDPAKVFVAESVTLYGNPKAFTNALRTDIAAHDGRAVVFVHGYNTGFDSAIYRMTQLVQDSGFPGTPILFTWASGGKTVDYVYDNNSATAARDSLEQTLKIVKRAGAKRIDIIAHSMGNWVVMEALRQLAIEGDRDLGNTLGDVVLASPDIDVDVFKAQMRRYGKPDKPFAVLISDDDKALRIASFIAGDRPRVGDYHNTKELAELGVIVVDLTNIPAGDRLNHTKFADNPLLVKILGDRLANSDSGAGGADGATLTRRINGLARGLGQTVGSTADIVITTPFEVLRIAVGR